MCFHGPVTKAIPFFGSLGFECPVRKDPANFLQEVTTPKGSSETYASSWISLRRVSQTMRCCMHATTFMLTSCISAFTSNHGVTTSSFWFSIRFSRHVLCFCLKCMYASMLHMHNKVHACRRQPTKLHIASTDAILSTCCQLQDKFCFPVMR